jgi:hypothetical protein
MESEESIGRGRKDQWTGETQESTSNSEQPTTNEGKHENLSTKHEANSKSEKPSPKRGGEPRNGAVWRCGGVAVVDVEFSPSLPRCLPSEALAQEGSAFAPPSPHSRLPSPPPRLVLSWLLAACPP